MVALVVLLAGYAGVEGKSKRTDRRIARAKQKLDLILGHSGLCQDDPALEQVAGLLRDGRKNHAIKAYRETTAADLKETKETVERMG
jgi:hypothetical protein